MPEFRSFLILNFGQYKFQSNETQNYNDDQIVNRMIMKDMGKGSQIAAIRFRNPLLVSSRRVEHLVELTNLTHPQKAYREGYPSGAYAYS